MRTRVIQPLLACVVALLALLACRAAPPESSVVQRVENSQLGLALASLPEAFRVEANEAGTFRFHSADGHAVLSIEAGPEQVSGINLVDEIKKQRAWFLEAAEGHYFGNRELATPNGPAFTARGAYTTAEGRVEETWAFALHPAANRLVTLTYRYPSGSDSEQRVFELLEILGEIEALDQEASSATEG